MKRRHFDIRPLTIEEVDAALPIAIQLVQSGKSTHGIENFDVEKALSRVRSWVDDPDHLILGGFQDGEMVAVYIGFVAEWWHMRERWGWIRFLAVDPRKGRGIGRLMVEEFMRWAKTRGANKVQLSHTVGIDPQGAERMFERLGMERVGSVFIGEI